MASQCGRSGGAQTAMRSWGFLEDKRLGVQRSSGGAAPRPPQANSSQPTPAAPSVGARLDGASHDLLEAHSLWEVGQPADNALDEVLTAACAIPGGIFPALNTNHTGPRFGVPPSEERPA